VSFDTLNDAGDEGDIQPAVWAQQTLWWSERYRSRGLLWPADADWFANDPLGPMPHTHPNASEIFFLATGSLQLTVGSDVLTLEPGDFVLVPPDTYHEPLNVGGTDLCVLVVVAPNWRDERWKPSGFVDSDYAGKAQLAGTAAPGPLPSDELIESQVVELAPGQSLEVESRPDADRLVYVLEGVAHFTLEHLSGEVRSHQFVNVMAGARHQVANHSERPMRYLSCWTAYGTGH